MVVRLEHDFLELFVGEPEADVPGDEAGEGGVEALVEGKETLPLPRLDGALERAPVMTLGTVHESNKK